jgi:hypothetical protein
MATPPPFTETPSPALEMPSPSTAKHPPEPETVSISLFSPIPIKKTEIHQIEEFHTPTGLRYRENIGRIGSLRIFWQMSVIAVFPLKTGIRCSLSLIPKTHHTIPIGIWGFRKFF